MNAEQHTAPNQQMAIAPCYDDQSNHITHAYTVSVLQYYAARRLLFWLFRRRRTNNQQVPAVI